MTGELTLNLMFQNNAEEAVTFYVDGFSPLFGNSRILKTTYYGRKNLQRSGMFRKLPRISCRARREASGPSGSCSTGWRSLP